MTTISIRFDHAAGRIGPGKIALLSALAEAGSLGAAAARLGMSYRRAWALSEQLNALSETPLISKTAGGASRGGATLTETGQRVLAVCEAGIAAAQSATSEQCGELDHLLK